MTGTARPLGPWAIAELHKEPALWHVQDYMAIDSTVQRLQDVITELVTDETVKWRLDLAASVLPMAERIDVERDGDF